MLAAKRRVCQNKATVDDFKAVAAKYEADALKKGKDAKTVKATIQRIAKQACSTSGGYINGKRKKKK